MEVFIAEIKLYILIFALSINPSCFLISQVPEWEPSNKGIENVKIKEIVICDNGTIFAIRDCRFLDQEFPTQIPVLYRSTNDGMSWENMTPNIPGHENIGKHRVLYGLFVKDNSVFIKHWVGNFPERRGHLLLRSDDFGVTWKEIAKDFGFASNPFLEIGTDNNLYLRRIFDGSIWRSSDNGNTWINVLKKGQVDLSSKIHIGQNGYVLGQVDLGDKYWKGNSSNIIKILEDKVTHSIVDISEFKKITTEEGFAHGELKLEGPVIRGKNETNLFATFMYKYGFASFLSGLFISQDDGENWKMISRNTSATLVDSKGRIWGASQGLVFSIDKGQTWMPISEGLPGKYSSNALAEHPSGTFFIGIENGIFKLDTVHNYFSFVIEDVPLIGQPTEKTCWAASTTMMLSWDRKKKLPIKETIDEFNWWKYLFSSWDARPTNFVIDLKILKKWGGLPISIADDFFINEVGLTGNQMSPSIEGIKELLQKSPILVSSGATVSIEGDDHHIIVMVGIYGNGKPNETYIVYHDPWDGGTTEEETYEDFMRRYQGYLEKNPGSGQEILLYYFDKK